MQGFSILCPAKVNLRLKVLRKRPDGYHDIETLMQPVALFDEIAFSFEGGGIDLTCDNPELSAGEDNLVYKAIALYREKTGDAFGLKAHLRKRIPMGAGLGGGSSDAAGVLLALNRERRGGLSLSELIPMAKSLGADVPFFLLEKPAKAAGIGEILEPVRIIPQIWYVLLFPGWSVSTRWAYENLDMGLTKTHKEFKIPQFIMHANDILELLDNDFESVTAREHPWIGQTKDSLIGHGALGAMMSGSGPTVFGVFGDYTSADNAYRSLRDENGQGVWLARGLPCG